MEKLIKFYKKAVLDNYFNFKSRATREEYWWFFLANVIISFILGLIDGAMEMQVISNLYSLAVFLPGLGAGVRRLHDINKSGWWIIAPFYNLYLLAQKGNDEKNSFGEVVKN